MASRKIENQALYRERWFPLAQVVQPNQPKREHAIGMTGIGRDADGRPRRRTLPQQGARIRRRESVFKIGFGGQLGKFVSRVLTAQKSPELLTESEPGATQRQVVAHRASPVDQFQDAWGLPEADDLQHQFAARFAFNGDYAPHQVAPLIPGLQLGARAARFEHEIFRSNREPLLTRLAQHGILAGFEKALDGAEDFCPKGFCHYSLHW